MKTAALGYFSTTRARGEGRTNLAGYLEKGIVK